MITIRIKREKWPPHQIKFWDLPNSIKILVGGVGCGKTFIGCLRGICLSYLNSGIPGMLVSQTYPKTEDIIVPTMKDILTNKMGMTSGIDYRYHETKHNLYIYPWDGLIKLRSGDDPDSLVGDNLAWAGIDEPFKQEKLVFDECRRRLRHPKTKVKELFMTGTPEALNWGFDICMNNEKKYDVGFVVGLTKDNQYNLPGFYEELKASYSIEEQKAYLEGQFINLNVGQVYKEFDRYKHIKHVDFNSSFQIYAGVDFNVDYMTAEIFWYANNWIHFIDEIRLTHTNTFELAEKLKAKYPGINIYPDPTGGARKTSSDHTDHQILKDAGFTVRCRSRVEVRDKVNAVNSLLRKNCLSIEPGVCPWLIKDFERCIWKSGDIDKKSDVTLSHAADAAGYAIEYLYPVLKREAYTIKV